MRSHWIPEGCNVYQCNNEHIMYQCLQNETLIFCHWNYNRPYNRTVKPSYSDIGLCDNSPTASDIVVPINSSLLTTTLHTSVRTTLVYRDKRFRPLYDVTIKFD